MYFAVAKFTFEQTGKGLSDDRKELRNLVEKIRSRFRVSCAIVSDEESNGESAIAVAALASSEEALSRNLDSIAEFCETAGFGRVESEQTLLDHIDAIEDYLASDNL